MKRTLIIALMFGMLAGGAQSGDLIRKACLKAGRIGATRAMCGCIQQVADVRLKRQEQKLAASFFKDPHKAQVIRQSDRKSHETFWQRYKIWAADAEESCAETG